MKIENLLVSNNVLRYAAESKGNTSFSAMLHDSMENKLLTGTISHTKKDALRLHELEDGPDRASELEGKYCSMCGSLIDEKGLCPICTIPIFISGNPQAYRQSLSRAEDARAKTAGGSPAAPQMN